MPSLYEQQFDEFYALYKQGKFAECIELGGHNLTDPGMSPYLSIKTHCILAGAVDEWRKAEKYRITAESAYRAIFDTMRTRGMTQHDRTGLQDLRTNLDDLCRYQSKWAPDDYSLKGATYPPREGRVRDLIAWRKGITADGWESSDDEEQERKYLETKEGQEEQMDTSKDDEPEDMLDKPVAQKDDDILLEDPLGVQAADDELFGKDQNMIGAMNEAVLEERCKENAEPKDQEGEQASKDEATEE